MFLFHFVINDFCLSGGEKKTEVGSSETVALWSVKNDMQTKQNKKLCEIFDNRVMPHNNA